MSTSERNESLRLILAEQQRGLASLDSLRSELRSRALSILALGTAISGLTPVQVEGVDPYISGIALFSYALLVASGARIASPSAKWKAWVSLGTVSEGVRGRDEGVSVNTAALETLTVSHERSLKENRETLEDLAKEQNALLILLVITTVLWVIAILTATPVMGEIASNLQATTVQR